MRGRAVLAHALEWVVRWQAIPKTGGQMRVRLRGRGLAGTLLQMSVDLEIPHDQSAEWTRSTRTMEKRGDVLLASEKPARSHDPCYGDGSARGLQGPPRPLPLSPSFLRPDPDSTKLLSCIEQGCTHASGQLTFFLIGDC